VAKRFKGLIIFLFLAATLLIAYFFFRTTLSTTGEIFVDSFPKECEVYLNGNLKGTTPITLKNLSLGSYELKVSKAGYKEDVRQIVLDRNNVDKVVMVALEHATFILQVNSSPANAEVYVDGVKKGLTPIEISDLIIGKHFIEVTMGNYSKWTKEIDEIDEINFSNGNTVALDVSLSPSTASITINTVPDSAKVIINGVEKGVTPFIMNNVEPGNYQIKVIKDGYTPYAEGLVIAKGDNIKRDLALTKANTFLMIDSNPEGATVFINGENRGVTPYAEANLSPGTYSLRIVKDGYLEFSTEIEVLQDKTSDYSFPLLKLP
jgi:hypothetical protein